MARRIARSAIAAGAVLAGLLMPAAAQPVEEFYKGRTVTLVISFGAGGLVAANHLYNAAPQDGSVLAQLDRSVAQSGIRGAANVKFDPLKLSLIHI